MAKSPRFINFSELSDELRHFVEAGAKIFPIDIYESLPSEKVYEFYRILSGSHKNEIYGWSESDNSYELIGADDRDIRWDDVQFKPDKFIPSTHTHTSSEITDFPSELPPASHIHTESDIADLDKYTKSEVDSALNSKVDKVDGKSLSTNDFTDADKSKLDSLTESATVDYTSMQQELNIHKTSTDHDGRYYTKSESDVLLSSKANNSTVNGHINSTTIHVTQTDKDSWNSKVEVVQSAPTTTKAGQIIFLEVV